MANFEELYSEFLINEYGTQFFRYTLLVNVSIVVFLLSIITMLKSNSNP